MSDFVILALIAVLVVVLMVTLLALLLYSGLLAEVLVRTGAPPVKKITVAYKFTKGSYKDSGALFTESCSIAPKLSSIGIYYDDPNQTEADRCRYAVGSILSEDEDAHDEELQSLYEKFGFRVITFPEISCAVTSTFPNRCPLSPICGAYRVFPQLNAYITERKLSARPFLEICKGDVIHYMCPLENQESFFVPELFEKQTVTEQETKDDSDVKKTGECKSDDAASSTEASSLENPEMKTSSTVNPKQDDENGQNEEGDRGSKGSSDSVGSGSSFEELDMDMDEDGKERKMVEEGNKEDKEKKEDNKE